MSPLHSIGYCPICGGGLCGIRICGGDETAAECDPKRTQHGLVVCDECEAIWLEPDLGSDHTYADPELARCPVCRLPLWSPPAHWADRHEIETLGWSHAIDHHLDRS